MSRFRWLSVIAVIGMTAQGFAQEPGDAALQTFEVASVRLNNSAVHGGHLGFDEDTFRATNQTFKTLLKFACNTNNSIATDDQMTGGPGWVDSAKFDVEAKINSSVAAELQKLSSSDRADQVRQMMQTLLAERFKLKMHRETRDLSAYALVVAKGGAKVGLKPSNRDAAVSEKSMGMTFDTGKLDAKGVPLPTLVADLSVLREIHRKVLDKTGLDGRYDFMLQWTPETGPANATSPEDAGPSLFTALQEQLGLKLEPIKVPTDMIVIDHVEMPQGN